MIDVAANRKSVKWRNGELVARVLWGAVSFLFALTPRPAWGVRRFILRVFGAEISAGVHIYPSVRIMIPWNLKIGPYAAIGDRAILYALGPITIGARAVISPYAYLCAGSHDYRTPAMPLLKSPIVIGADAWICTGAYVGPGVTIGDRAILAARGVAVSDIDPEIIAGGNPAREIKKREGFRCAALKRDMMEA